MYSLYTDRSITHSLQKRVSTKYSTLQLECILIFTMSLPTVTYQLGIIPRVTCARASYCTRNVGKARRYREQCDSPATDADWSTRLVQRSRPGNNANPARTRRLETNSRYDILRCYGGTSSHLLTRSHVRIEYCL